ncbi:hypothetical protein D3C80_2219150 [compost metagenome]|jgi:putative ATP-binding cassette transporter
MDEEARKRAYAILTGPLKDASVIHIGKGLGHNGLFTRQLHLEMDLQADPLRLPHQTEATV